MAYDDGKRKKRQELFFPIHYSRLTENTQNRFVIQENSKLGKSVQVDDLAHVVSGISAIKVLIMEKGFQTSCIKMTRLPLLTAPMLINNT